MILGGGVAASLVTRDMVAEVNYSVGLMNIQPQETFRPPEVRQKIVLDELPRPHYDKKVSSVGMIGSAHNGANMQEYPQAQISKPNMRRKISKHHLQLRAPQKTMSVFMQRIGKDF